MVGTTGEPSRSDLGEGRSRNRLNWTDTDSDLPGDIEDGMSGRNGQRKPGTTRGSPRRSRTAKAWRISHIVGEIAMCLRVGRMGPTSDEGRGQNNPDRSEGPWGGGNPPPRWRTNGSPARHSAGQPNQTRKCAKGGSQPDIPRCMPGAGLSREPLGRRGLKCQPSSRTGENPPYGMIGGSEETSASCEVRSAPRSYPTAGGVG